MRLVVLVILVVSMLNLMRNDMSGLWKVCLVKMVVFLV